MIAFILGEKKQQSRMFDDQGRIVPVTVVNSEPCYLVDVVWDQGGTRNYRSVKLGFGIAKSMNKPTRGHLEKAGIKTPLRFLKEIRIHGDASLLDEEGKKGIKVGETKIFIGDQVKPAMLFKKGDAVDISGTSKGKGFQGVVKRHAFAGGPKTHGQSDRQRGPGSMGQTTTPGRVYRGKRMAGRMGGERVTVQNLIVMDANDKTLTVKGLIPGHTNGVIEVRSHGL